MIGKHSTSAAKFSCTWSQELLMPILGGRLGYPGVDWYLSQFLFMLTHFPEQVGQINALSILRQPEYVSREDTSW